MKHGFLALAPQYTPTRELLASSARRRGMGVEVLPARGGVTGTTVEEDGGHYYGGPVFAAGVVDELAVALLEPDDGWLAGLPHVFTRRHITTSTLGEARRLSGPAFVKPPSDKSFRAAVHDTGGSLPEDPELPPESPVLISEVVTWAAEFRLFVLDGEVRTGSQYATYGRSESVPLDGHPHRDAVLEFAGDLLATCGDSLPSAVVVDVGLLTTPENGAGSDWAVVEANMAWFSDCYAADPDRALDVVLRAAGPRARITDRDRRFCRNRGAARPPARRTP
ncbi:ATP-grasp domain-containing protein [Streptomyces syringium]|uniref:ATP-grasp domain-containing protein n=1 Tax=Streptomyces syringium TaxID=76729 RepID=UPI0034115112